MATTNMPVVILRSICVGIVSVVVTIYLAIFAELAFAMRWATKNAPSGLGGGEVGIDIVTLVHNSPPIAILFPLAFAIGFYFGFRYFSRSAARK